MSITGPRLAAVAGIAFLALFGAIALGYALGLRLNVTPSVPTGIYLRTDLQLRRGSLVMVCLDPNHPAIRLALDRHYLPSGHCPGGVAPLLKPIAGLPGDRIEQTAAGLAVNGQLLPGTIARFADPAGRPLPSPPQPYTVPAGHVLLAVSNPSSFDGRYFGPTALRMVQSGARAVWIF